MQLAPIAFFAYKRPEHTFKALTALSECTFARESTLYIFCDGPKRQEDFISVGKVREVVASKKWCGKVNIIARDKNTGLANSVIDGVSRLCDEFGKVIVIEDDLIVAKGFLDYMNRALDLYNDNPQVMQISGHRFPFYRKNDDDSAFFMPVTNSWGWSTWDRAWSLFDAQAVGWERLKHDRSLRRKFDLDGAYPFSKMLFDQMSGRIDSWAIRWLWSFFKHNGLSLYPAQSMVRNIGFGEGATHTTEPQYNYNDLSWDQERETCKLPERISEGCEEFLMFKCYLSSLYPQPGILARLLGRMKRIICSAVDDKKLPAGPNNQ